VCPAMLTEEEREEEKKRLAVGALTEPMDVEELLLRESLPGFRRPPQTKPHPEIEALRRTKIFPPRLLEQRCLPPEPNVYSRPPDGCLPEKYNKIVKASRRKYEFDLEAKRKTAARRSLRKRNDTTRRNTRRKGMRVHNYREWEEWTYSIDDYGGDDEAMLTPIEGDSDEDESSGREDGGEALPSKPAKRGRGKKRGRKPANPVGDVIDLTEMPDQPIRGSAKKKRRTSASLNARAIGSAFSYDPKLFREMATPFDRMDGHHRQGGHVRGQNGPPPGGQRAPNGGPLAPNRQLAPGPMSGTRFPSMETPLTNVLNNIGGPPLNHYNNGHRGYHQQMGGHQQMGDPGQATNGKGQLLGKLSGFRKAKGSEKPIPVIEV